VVAPARRHAYAIAGSVGKRRRARHEASERRRDQQDQVDDQGVSLTAGASGVQPTLEK
jgi:hypothetical protein